MRTHPLDRWERLVVGSRFSLVVSMAGVRAWSLRAAAVAVGLVAALVLVEGLLRVLTDAPVQGIVTVTASQYDAIPGIFAPNQNFIDSRIPGYRRRVTTGSLGYRGREFSAEKPNGEYRILMTGDSFTYGPFVGDDETLPSQVEASLSQRCTGVRIINAGLGGTSLVAHRALAERGLAISPDLVVLTFSENDVLDLGSTSQWAQLAANRAAKSRFPLSLMYPLLHRTSLWNLALRVRSQLRARAAPPMHATLSGDIGDTVFPTAPASSSPSGSAMLLDLRAEYVVRLGELRDMLAGHGVPLHFSAFPSHMAVTGQSSEQIDWFVGATRDLGIPGTDLLPRLQQSGLGAALYLLPYDGHPSPTGYEIAGATLAEHLITSGTLGERCSPTSTMARHGARSRRAPR